MIRKFQSGGESVFTTYTPFTGATAQLVSGSSGVPTGTSSTASESKLSDKDLMNMVKEIDGLPSDMQVVLGKILQLTATQNLFGGSSSINNLSSTYLQALTLVKIASWNKKQYDAAYKQASDNGSLSEIAITPDGKIYAQDKKTGNPTAVSMQELESGKYTPLTNSNLLYLRAHYQQYANNNDLFMTVENGIGMKAVTDLIQNACEKMGSSLTTLQGYQSTEAQKGMKVISQLKEKGIDVSDLMSLNGLYESKIITKNLLSQAHQALEYIMNALPQNAKTWLALKSGNTSDPDLGAKDMLTNLVMSKTSDEFSFTPTYKEDLNSDGTKKSDGADKLSLNPAMQFIEGYGESELFPLQVGTMSGLAINATRLPVTKEGNPLGAGSTLQQITSSDFGGVFDKQNISMGGQMLDPNNGLLVIIDGDVHSMDLPYDKDEYAKTGNIKPDFKLLNKVDEADRYIRDNHITSYDEINKVYKSKGIPAKYDANGNLNLTEYKRFAAFNAKADAKAFANDVTFDDDFMSEITKDNQLNSFEMAVRKANSLTEKLYKLDKISGWDSLVGGGQHWYSSHDAVYQGTIFAPIVLNRFNSLNGNITAQQALEMEALQQQNQRAQQMGYVNPGTL